MNELENLKEIGLKEISRKTHIEPTFLQYIFDKNFEKLSRLNIRGYAKLLQKFLLTLQKILPYKNKAVVAVLDFYFGSSF